MNIKRRIREAFIRATCNLVLPPGMAWITHQNLIGGCISGIMLGHHPMNDRSLMLWSRLVPCRFQHCKVHGTAGSWR